MSTFFEITPPGLSDDDLKRVGAEIEAQARQKPDFVLNAHFARLRLLLVVHHVGGKVADWLLMPCSSRDEAAELLDWTPGQVMKVIEDMYERRARAAEAAGGVVAALLKQKD